MLVVLLIRGVTLPGAARGIQFYLYPNLTRLWDPQVRSHRQGPAIPWLWRLFPCSWPKFCGGVYGGVGGRVSGHVVAAVCGPPLGSQSPGSPGLVLRGSSLFHSPTFPIGVLSLISYPSTSPSGFFPLPTWPIPRSLSSPAPPTASWVGVEFPISCPEAPASSLLSCLSLLSCGLQSASLRPGPPRGCCCLFPGEVWKAGPERKAATADRFLIFSCLAAILKSWQSQEVWRARGERG